MHYPLKKIEAALKDRAGVKIIPTTVDGLSEFKQHFEMWLHCATEQFGDLRITQYSLSVVIGSGESAAEFDLAHEDGPCPAARDLPELEFSLHDLAFAVRGSALQASISEVIDHCVGAEIVPHARVEIVLDEMKHEDEWVAKLLIKDKEYIFPIESEQAEQLLALVK